MVLFPEFVCQWRTNSGCSRLQRIAEKNQKGFYESLDREGRLKTVSPDFWVMKRNGNSSYPSQESGFGQLPRKVTPGITVIRLGDA